MSKRYAIRCDAGECVIVSRKVWKIRPNTPKYTKHPPESGRKKFTTDTTDDADGADDGVGAASIRKVGGFKESLFCLSVKRVRLGQDSDHP